MVLPPMYPRSPPTAGRNLEISQPGKNLPTNLNQFIQPLLQVLHVGGIDPTIFIGGFGVLVQIVAAHLQEILFANFLKSLSNASAAPFLVEKGVG